MINDEDICIIIQGPIYKNFRRVLNGVKKVFPKSQIIVSTWENQSIKRSHGYKVLKNKDPGASTFCTDPKLYHSENRQIKSTLNALRKTKKKTITQKIYSVLHFFVFADRSGGQIF